MNDGGGGESLKEIEPSLKKRRRKNDEDEFAQAIARIAVSQVCESVGFHGFQQSALDAFSDVACKYVREIGKVSRFYSELAERTECNVFDVVQGLEDLNLSQGFVGASDRDGCLAGSGIVKDLSMFVNLSEEIGFAYSVPSFPIVKERKFTPSFLQAGETPPTEAIPPWLPVFLDPRTDTSVPSVNAEETQMVTDGNEREQKLLDPPPPSKLEQLRARNESVFPTDVEQGINPFLSAPLQPGEKEVSLVSLPAKLKEDDMVQNHNHVSELVQSAVTNHAVKNGGCGTEEGVRVVSENRPTVQVKFRMGKRSLSNAIRPTDKGKEKVGAWFINDEVTDENEKKTEKLSNVAMDIEGRTGNISVVNQEN